MDFFNQLDDFVKNIDWNEVTDFLKQVGKALLIVLAAYIIYAFVKSLVESYFIRKKMAKDAGYDSWKAYYNKPGGMAEHKAERKQEEALEKLKEMEPTEDQQRLLQAEEAVWATQSVEPLQGVANEPYIQQTATQLTNLKNQRLQRSFNYEPDPNLNKLHREIEVKDDGKIKRGLTSVFGRCEFIWKNQQNGEIAAKKILPFAELQFTLASGLRSPAGEYRCVNCGSPIEESNDDVLHCPYCKSISYREDYSDLMTQMNVYSFNVAETVETKVSAWFLRYAAVISLVLFLVYMTISIFYSRFQGRLGENLSSFLDWLTSLLPDFGALFESLNLPPSFSMFLPAIGFFLLMYGVPRILSVGGKSKDKKRRQEYQAEQEYAKRKDAIYHFTQKDPLFSVELAKAELLMMFKALALSPDTTAKKTWGIYTEPERRPAMQQVLFGKKTPRDLIINNALLSTFREADGQAHLRFFIDYDALQEKNSGDYSLKQRFAFVDLSRNEHGRTVLLEGSETAECPNCGAAVQLLTQDSCHYCQTGFHRDQMYWRITDILPASEDDRPYIDESEGGSRRNTWSEVQEKIPMLRKRW